MNGETILGQSEGGNDAGYLAFDLGAEYYFLNTKKVAPYLLAGMGVSFFGDYITVANPGCASKHSRCIDAKCRIGCQCMVFGSLGT